MIQISSQVKKYEDIYNDKVAKSKKHECDTLVFGYILGEKKAFLIQNMCPVTDKYINNKYIDFTTGDDISVNSKLDI